MKCEIISLGLTPASQLVMDASREEVSGEAWRERMDKWLDLRGPNLGQWEPGSFLTTGGVRPQETAGS